MVKLVTISYQFKLLRKMIVYHGIRTDGDKFELCLYSTSHLESQKIPHVGPHLLRGSLSAQVEGNVGIKDK